MVSGGFRKTLLALAIAATGAVASALTLEEGFLNPPKEARPHLWWHWMNGNVSKEGITADLEAMAAVGIGGAQIFDAGCGIPPGEVEFASSAWFDAFDHAGREAKRLGLELCHANCSGWSSSGGPWITPDKAMKRVFVAEGQVLSGPTNFAGIVARPAMKSPEGDFYEDIALLAIPVRTNLAHLADWRAKSFYNRNSDITADRRRLGADQVLAKPEVVDLLPLFDQRSERLVWKVPAGEWRLLRIGCGSTGQRNHPASAKGVGLEVDKLSAPAVRFHMEQYCAKLARNLDNVLIDSYEVGSQNWTQGFADTFRRARGYSLTPYLPLVAAGYVVGSVEESERFLEDFRRVIADEFAASYAGELRKCCHELGLRLSLEPYGNCPADNLQYGKYADIPSGEFWSHGSMRNTDEGNARLAAHVAHAWGRRIVAMEAFSADPQSGGRWTTTPFALKAECDAAYAAGANRMVYHRFVHQPWKTPYLPGLTMGRWGIHFERSNTWWYEQREWLKYQSRCQWMLMEGRFCADVLYYYGEGAPNLRCDWYYGLDNPTDLPKGYDYDQCDRGALLAARTEKGRVVLPGGVAYAVLVLPPDEFMSLAVAEKLEEFAAAGVTIIGTVRPTRTPGLAGDDAKLKEKVDRLWPDRVHEWSVKRALKEAKIAPDCLCATEAVDARWTHRRGADGSDWYFVAAHTAASVDKMAFSFVKDGRLPELWNPETGVIERAREVKVDWTGRMVVTIDDFPAEGSMFIVFRDRKSNLPVAHRYRTVSAQPLSGPWKLFFPPNRKAPASVVLPALVSWADHADPGVRYFSGSATYEYISSVPVKISAGQRLIVDLGEVRDFAAVTANGVEYPTLWRPPYRQDVTDAVKDGQLKLSVRVTNLWPNRLIGDERECAEDCEWKTDAAGETGIVKLPDWVKRGERSPSGRLTFTTWKHWRASDDLLPSGLLGPVTIRVRQ